jgi:hypothetical protein
MGIFSGLLGGGGKPKVDDGGRADQIKRIDALDIPDEEKMKLILENPQLVGLLEAEGIDPSKMGDIQEDPRLRENQMQALEMLKERSTEGLTASDKYEMEKMLGDVSANERSQRASIEDQMARQGMDSSGAAERSKRENVQSQANNARDIAMQKAAQAQQNKMGALAQLGQQSGQMQNADFNRQAQTASAQDAIARANAMNRQNVSGQNLAARQAIENQRAGTANEQQRWNTQADQRRFNNEEKKLNLYNRTIGPQTTEAAGPSAGAQLGSIAGGLAGAYYGGAEGAGAGASAGGSIGGALFEDGGVANAGLPIQDQAREAETKQRESFKKKYLKQIQEEVLGAGEKPKTPELPQGKTGHGGNNAANGGVMESLLRDSEKRPEGGTDLASPDDRKALIMQALQAQMQNLNPETQVPMRRENGGTMYASDGSGDVIDSGMESYAGDRVDAKVNDGEMVINLPQQQRLMDLIKGEISVDELGNDDIVEGVPREYRDEMHEDGENDKMAAIRQMLEMLGDK